MKIPSKSSNSYIVDEWQNLGQYMIVGTNLWKCKTLKPHVSRGSPGIIITALYTSSKMK